MRRCEKHFAVRRCPPFLRELTQEAQIIPEKLLQIVDAVLQHRQTVHAKSERKTRVAPRLVMGEIVDCRVDHACAKHFNPAGMLAGPAALSRANVTGGVEFGRGFREREVAWTQAHARLWAEKFLRKVFNGAFEIAKGNVRVDGQAFEL